ncbi:meiosis-specific nuclear structural protein 1-like [Anopheles ziemanni]|uniref:meiosis-specific nuclear structural protein 1-like n=1 Tax=Anopheles ziemanni TaxID=345580 RepID=UPI00265E6582|nr:meiosis-specific nuclear structural protein 1-like [Anopheles ziemanni]
MVSNYSANQKQRQLKQSAFCRAVESNRLNANFQKDLDQIQRNSLEQWKRQEAEQQARQREQELQQKRKDAETLRRQQLLRDQEQTQLLHEVNRQKINEAKQRQQLRESNQELRELESKLRAAYVAKGIAAQLAEAELRKNAERIQVCKEKREFEEAQQANVEYMKSKQIADANEKLLFRSVLLEQIKEARYAKKCMYEEFLKEKMHLDAVVKKIQDEHLEEIQRKLEQQNCTRQEMEYFQEAKKTWKARQELLAQEENDRIRKYREEKDRLKAKEIEQKAEMDRKREERNDAMIGKLEQETMEKRKREEMLQELYIAETEEKDELKRIKDLEENVRKRIAIRLALESQLMEIKCQKEVEAEEEKRFQAEQIKVWAANDRIDIMTNEKRRRKMIEYRQNVQVLLEKRRKQRIEDVKLAVQQENLQREEEKRRHLIIEEERIKLLKEHATALLGFFPPGVLRESDREFIPLPKQNDPKKTSGK